MRKTFRTTRPPDRHLGADRVQLRQALAWATDLLSGFQERDVAQLEAEVLLCHQLRITRSQLYSHLDESLDLEELRRFGFLVERRAAREPVAYIVGHKEFFGLDFAVDRRVLIPRPETELLVETVLTRLRDIPEPENGWLVADVGTGCGAVAVSLAFHLPKATVYAIDISRDALDVADINCRRHGVQDRVLLRQGDLVGVLPGSVDVIVANLPYIAHGELAALPPDVREFEPLRALDGGGDGLDQYRGLLGEAPRFLRRGGMLVAEFGAGQGKSMLSLAQYHFPTAKLELLLDLAGIDRALSVVA